MSAPVKIAVDAMGSDHGPEAVVAGAVLALREKTNGSRRSQPVPTELILVGEEKQIRRELGRLKAEDLPIQIAHASEQVQMEEQATEGWKKKDSSIAVAMRLQKERQVQAVVSGGNTGAVMTTALLTLGRLQGVIRPAIASLFPTLRHPTVILDVGANADCKAQHLQQFGVMGSIYYSRLLKRTEPRVGLLSIGEEKSKGNELVLASHRLLAETPVNFIGNVEGRDILRGQCEVVVTDGFTGNVMLKFAESVYGFLASKFRDQIRSNVFSKVGVFLLGPFLRRMKRTLDYAEYGGAPLLGIDGVCIICHGKSSPLAIKNAIKVAEQMVTEKVNEQIKEQLAAHALVAT